MASNSCCSWRSFQVRGANECTGTPGPRGTQSASRVLEGTCRGRGTFEDRVFSFLSCPLTLTSPLTPRREAAQARQRQDALPQDRQCQQGPGFHCQQGGEAGVHRC